MKRMFVMLLIAAIVCSMSACRSGNISVSNTEPNVSDGTQSTEGTLATGPADSDVDPTVPSENDRPTKPTVPDEKKPD